MEQRTTGIIATAVAVLLCGLPGLVGLCLGATFAVIGVAPGATVPSDYAPRNALIVVLLTLCVSMILIAIPVVVGFLTLRQRGNGASPPVSDEPIPPPL